MQGCCKALLTLAGADRCSIMILEGGTEELSVRWAQGSRVKPYGRMKFKMGEGLCGWVARSQKPLFSFDVTREPRFVPSVGSPRHFQPVKSFCCLPLITDGRTVGVVNLSSFQSTPQFRYCVRARFTKEFLEHLARVIARTVLMHEMESSSERWRKMYKATSETVAQVSHEVRTPLAIIGEGTQQILDGLAGPVTPKQKELLGSVARHADRMLNLVTELLDLSRIEAGRFTLQRRPMDLAGVIQEVCASCRPVIDPRKLRLELQPVAPVYGDRLRLGQVVENLLVNAVKFTPTTGSITLHLSARGRSAECAITDTGIGIPKREQQRLFERFFQSKVPAHIAARGTGLGLTIVKEIVQLHGGTIRVASQPGEGTTFTVSLPLYSAIFALTEEFRLLREQAAREGLSLACQYLSPESGRGVSPQQLAQLLERHVSKDDRVLLGQEGAVVLLSVLDSEGFQAMRRRLELILSAQASLPAKGLRWGSVFVPQEGTQLNEVLELAKQRSREV